MKILILLLATITLTGCMGHRSTKSLTIPETDKLHSLNRKHLDCLFQKSDKLMKGSEDVQFLTQVVISGCESNLKEVEKYLLGLNMPLDFIQGYVNSSRQQGFGAISEYILAAKANKNSN